MSRYVKTGGPYWGAEFEDLCRGHRLYVLRPNAGPSEELDLHEDPEGNHVGAPVPCTECTLCRKSAHEHGHGIHGVSVYGCPECGGDVERKQSRGSHSVVNYTRCYECAPPFPVLLWPYRAARRLVRWAR